MEKALLKLPEQPFINRDSYCSQEIKKWIPGCLPSLQQVSQRQAGPQAQLISVLKCADSFEELEHCYSAVLNALQCCRCDCRL